MRPSPCRNPSYVNSASATSLGGWPLQQPCQFILPGRIWRHHERLHETLVCGLPCSAIWLHLAPSRVTLKKCEQNRVCYGKGGTHATVAPASLVRSSIPRPASARYTLQSSRILSPLPGPLLLLPPALARWRPCCCWCARSSRAAHCASPWSAIHACFLANAMRGTLAGICARQSSGCVFSERLRQRRLQKRAGHTVPAQRWTSEDDHCYLNRLNDDQFVCMLYCACIASSRAATGSICVRWPRSWESRLLSLP